MKRQVFILMLIGIFEDGTVQGGSSGSPLFDPNNRIVGQLSTITSCGK